MILSCWLLEGFKEDGFYIMFLLLFLFYQDQRWHTSGRDSKTLAKWLLSLQPGTPCPLLSSRQSIFIRLLCMWYWWYRTGKWWSNNGSMHTGHTDSIDTTNIQGKAVCGGFSVVIFEFACSSQAIYSTSNCLLACMLAPYNHLRYMQLMHTCLTACVHAWKLEAFAAMACPTTPPQPKMAWVPQPCTPPFSGEDCFEGIVSTRWRWCFLNWEVSEFCPQSTCGQEQMNAHEVDPKVVLSWCCTTDRYW